MCTLSCLNSFGALSAVLVQPAAAVALLAAAFGSIGRSAHPFACGVQAGHPFGTNTAIAGFSVDSEHTVLHIDVSDRRPEGVPAVPDIDQDFVRIRAWKSTPAGAAVADCYAATELSRAPIPLSTLW